MQQQPYQGFSGGASDGSLALSMPRVVDAADDDGLCRRAYPACVNQWPADEFSDAAKLAYIELFVEDRRRSIVTVIFADLGRSLGASEAAGRRRMEALEKLRLARKLRPVRGGAEYYLIDARKIWSIKNRKLGIVGDAQRPLITAWSADGADQDADHREPTLAVGSSQPSREHVGGRTASPVAAQPPPPEISAPAPTVAPTPAPKSPRAHSLIEKKEARASHHLHRTTRLTHDHDGDANSTAAPALAPTEAKHLEDIEWRQRQAAADHKGPVPAPISDALVKALNAACDPRRRRDEKQQIINHICRVVSDPEMDPSIPGRAADAVLEYGLPRAVLNKILKSIASRPHHKHLKPIKNRGAHFYTSISNACIQGGIGWPPGQEQPP